MGAARHGGYRDGQLRRLVDSDFEAVPARENGHARSDYGRIGNGGDADYGRGGVGRRAREHDRGRDRGVVRQKDVMNGGCRSTSSRSDSGGSGYGGCSGGGGARKNNGFPVRSLDREPGELSSGSGSDGVADSGSLRKDGSELKKAENGENGRKDGSELKKAENGENGRKDGGELKKAENGENGKRKFSPIIWDKDVDSMKSARIVKARISGEAPTVKALPQATDSSSILPDLKLDVHVNVSPVQDGVAVISEEMVDVDRQPLQENNSAPSPVELSPLEPVSHTMEEKAVSVNDIDTDTIYVDYSSTYTMKSSRWANEAESSGDEGEIYEETARVKEKRGSESAETRQQRKSSTPELGELRREGSEENRSRHSEDRVSSDTDDAGSSGSMSDYISDEEEPAIPPLRTVNMLEACRSVEEFERLNRIDEGTYGVVFRAKDKKTGEVVALKKVKMEREREGFPLTALREMNILLSFSHPSIVDVKEVVVGSSLDSIFMVMEYMEHDLKGLMESMKQPFSQSEVKCLMLQLLEGVSYLHDNWVLHRDLKTSNILLNNRGELKICDFGLARQYGYPLKPYTPLVVTLWYRAPELLLGAKEYSTAIDMWSLGCIMAELLSKQPLFNGQTEVNQLDKIFTILGAPNEKIWPGFSKLPGAKVNMVKYPYSRLHTKFPAPSYSFTGAAPVAPVITDAGFDLLSRLLTYDPAKRITAQEALDHDWFREVPLPKSKEFMPTFPAQHNQDRRTRRVMKSPDPLEEQRRKELQQGELGAGGLFG